MFFGKKHIDKFARLQYDLPCNIEYLIARIDDFTSQRMWKKIDVKRICFI